MSRMYDMNDVKDLNDLGRLLSKLGIHFERNMFDQPYVILDHSVYKMIKSAGKNSSKKSWSKRKIPESEVSSHNHEAQTGSAGLCML